MSYQQELEASKPAHIEAEQASEADKGESANVINDVRVFDAAEEGRLRRKIDLHIVPIVAVLYLFCFIDRANIGNARLAGLEKDLGMRGYQYNTLLSVFYVSYIIFEIPANLCCKYFGPGKWIPFISFAFGLMSLCTAFVKTFAQAAAVRFLLGVFEAGMLPGVAYYLSRWYRKQELVLRLGFYIVMAPLAGAFGGLLASGILKIDGIGSVHTWQQIFLIEGLITCILSIIAYFTLADRPATAKWLTPAEKELAIARVKSENVGSLDVLDRIDWAKIRRGISNPNTLASAWVFLLTNIPAGSLAFFLPTVIRTIYPRNSVISQQLRTVPPYLVGAVFVLLVPYISMKIDRRVVFWIVSAVQVTTGYIMFIAQNNPQIKYGGTFLIASGAFVYGPLCNAQASVNTTSDTARSIGIGTVVMLGNVGGLIATWAFLPFDSPRYIIGNGINLGASLCVMATAVVLLLWMSRQNKKADSTPRNNALLDNLSPKEIEDLDWHHPDFRWRM